MQPRKLPLYSIPSSVIPASVASVIPFRGQKGSTYCKESITELSGPTADFGSEISDFSDPLQMRNRHRLTIVLMYPRC
jgi:hypothetical protein